MTKRAVIYVRMSQDKTGAGLGVQRQEEECRALAGRLGLTVMAVFSDNDISAFTGKQRPGYDAMLEAISRGEADAVIAWHGDRLHRRTSELERYIEVAGSIPTYTVNAGTHDLTTPSGRATAKTVAAWAQAEVEQKVERQRSKNRQSAANGEPLGGGAIPFGFKPDRLHLSDPEATMIRDAHAALLRGATLGSIIKAWNASGVRAPRGGRWSYSTVRGVLTRPLNAGLVFYDGRVLPGVEARWEPIVTPEEHFAVVSLLADPSRKTTDGNGRKHLLSGVATCGSCGSRLKAGATSSRGKKSVLYRCANHECTQKVHVAREHLNDEVERRFLAECGDRKVYRLVTIDGLDHEALAEVEVRIKSTSARLGEDDADVPSLVARLAELKTERAALKDRPAVPVIESGTVREEWTKADLNRKRELLTEHLDTLSIAPRGKVTHRFDATRVEVKWMPVLITATEPVYTPDDGEDFGQVA